MQQVKCEPNSRVSEACLCVPAVFHTTLIFLFRPLSRTLAPQPRGCELRISSPLPSASRARLQPGIEASSVRSSVRRSIDRPVDLSARPIRPAIRHQPAPRLSGRCLLVRCEMTGYSFVRTRRVRDPRLVVRLPDISGWHY